MSDSSDELHSYEKLLERIRELQSDWDEEGPVSPYKRYERETDLSRAGRWTPGSMLVRCPRCNDRGRFRDVPCPRCHGVGTVMCTKVDVRDGLV